MFSLLSLSSFFLLIFFFFSIHIDNPVARRENTHLVCYARRSERMGAQQQAHQIRDRVANRDDSDGHSGVEVTDHLLTYYLRQWYLW